MTTRDSVERSSSEVGGIAPNVDDNSNDLQLVPNDQLAQYPTSGSGESHSVLEDVLQSDVSMFF